MRRYRVLRRFLTDRSRNGVALPSRVFGARKETFHQGGPGSASDANFCSKEWHGCIRIAVYGAAGEPPRTSDIESADVRDLIERAAQATYREVREAGGSVSFLAIREIVENLIHAGFESASVSVLDGGQRVLVSDQGCGISDPERAMKPGFSTATPSVRRIIRGVGSGLTVAVECMARVAGEVVIEPNLQRGTVVTLRTPAVPRVSAPHVGARERFAMLPDRQKQVLLVMTEGNEMGPSAIAECVGGSLTTAHRDLARLEEAGLVAYCGRGKRVITSEGRALVAALLEGAGRMPGQEHDTGGLA